MGPKRGSPKLGAGLPLLPIAAVTELLKRPIETSFLACRYTFRVSRSRLYIKVIGSRSRLSVVKCTNAGSLPSTEKQFCYCCYISTSYVSGVNAEKPELG